MDASHFHSLGLLPILLLLLVLVSNQWLAKKSKSAKRRNHAPRPAGAWPVLGHLPLLGSHNNIGRALKAAADASGPVFSLRLGASPALVVSTRETAKECFTVHDKALAGRHPSTATKLMGYNNAMVGFSSYGPYWRQVRKIVTLELLSHAQLGSLAHVRASEVDAFARALHVLCRKGDEGRPARVEISKWFQELTFNVVVRMVAGKRCFRYGAVDDGRSSEARRFTGAIQRMMELLRAFVISDVVPFLKWMDLGGYQKAMKRNAAVMDCIIGGWLREHRERRMEGRCDGNQDFMDVMLSIMEEEGELLSDHDPDTVIKANSLVRHMTFLKKKILKKLAKLLDLFTVLYYKLKRGLGSSWVPFCPLSPAHYSGGSHQSFGPLGSNRKPWREGRRYKKSKFRRMIKILFRVELSVLDYTIS